MNWANRAIVILAILGCVVSCTGIALCVQEQKDILAEYAQLETQLKEAEEKYQSCTHDYAQLQVQLDTKQQELDALKKN